MSAPGGLARRFWDTASANQMPATSCRRHSMPDTMANSTCTGSASKVPARRCPSVHTCPGSAVTCLHGCQPRAVLQCLEGPNACGWSHRVVSCSSLAFNAYMHPLSAAQANPSRARTPPPPHRSGTAPRRHALLAAPATSPPTRTALELEQVSVPAQPSTTHTAA